MLSLLPELLALITEKASPSARFCFRMTCKALGGCKEDRKKVEADVLSLDDVTFAQCFTFIEMDCTKVASVGALKLLRWAHSNGCPWEAWTCACAARGGHLQLLQWARANGCPWDEMTCAYAAEGGHLTTLQWARTNGCPWDKWTCAYAAEGGHLALLQWARANGCPED